MNDERESKVDIKKPASYRYDDTLPAKSAMLEELLKETEFQQLFESFYNLITIPIAVIDLNANVLFSSRWQRICTQFHRVHPTACGRCIESDTHLALQLQEGKNYTIYACRNGLTDCASPIIIEGKHIANLFIGQFLTKEPDEVLFRRQAEEFGFDVDNYLAALHEVPIVRAEKIPAILDLLARMTRVITNLSIDRKRAVESQARQSIILNTIPQSVFWKDLYGRYLGCNVPFARAVGLAAPDDIVGKTDFDLPWPRSEAEAYRADDQAVISANRSRLHIIEPLQQADGSRLVVDTSKIPLVDAGNTTYGVVGIYDDVTERIQAEEKLKKAAEEWQTTFNATTDLFFLIDKNYRITQVNRAVSTFLGLPTEQIVGRHCFELMHGTDKPLHECPLSALQRSMKHEDAELYLKAQNIWVQVTVDPVLDGKGELLGAVHIVRDITERKKAENELQRLNRELRAISECNQVLVRAKDEKTLLDQICSIVCEKAGYLMSWVAYKEHDAAKTVRPVAWAGTVGDYLSTAKISWADTERGHGPTGTAIRRGENIYIQDFSTDPRVAPWREKALQRGYRSSIALPLKDKSDSTFGAFTLYSSEPEAFTPDEIRMLQELADDMAFGINVLRARTEQAQAEESLRASEDRYRTLFETANDAIFLMDGNTFIDCNSKAADMFGCKDKDEIVGRSPAEFSPATQPDGTHSVEKAQEYIDAALNSSSQRFAWEHSRKDGTRIDTEVSLNSFRLRGKNFLLALVRDVTERRKAEERIEYLAYYDALTGLPNRNLFLDRVNEGIARAELTSRLIAVLLMNIDRFKSINDAYGPDVGDRTLKEIAGRLSTSVRRGDIVARLSNDEFGIALFDTVDSDDIIRILEKILRDVSYPFKVEGNEIILTFGTGISVYPRDGSTGHELLKSSGLALRKAKEVGRKTYQFYTEDMNVKASASAFMEKHILTALHDEEFLLHYQPYWDMNTQKMVGMEALVRWQSKDMGLIAPGKFIPVLEDTGMIVEVGEWILKEALRQVKAWQDKGYPVVPVSVNLSLIQFRQKDLAAMVTTAIGATGIHPSLLTLEITESAFMQDLEFTNSALKTLKEIGCSVSIDDFGTGYSSLSYLKRFPIDNLKIDMSFIREITADPDTASIVTAIINMAHTLNLKTIAEGIETQEQWKFLRLLRCDMGQGYYFSKPLPAGEMEKLFISSAQ